MSIPFINQFFEVHIILPGNYRINYLYFSNHLNQVFCLLQANNDMANSRFDYLDIYRINKLALCR